AVLDGDERKLFVVAVPGDRDVDIKRLEASIAEALDVPGEPEIEPATEADIASHAGLVPGYIGPTLLTNGSAVQILGKEDKHGIQFFGYPLMVSESSCVTYANVE